MTSDLYENMRRIKDLSDSVRNERRLEETRESNHRQWLLVTGMVALSTFVAAWNIFGDKSTSKDRALNEYLREMHKLEQTIGDESKRPYEWN